MTPSSAGGRVQGTVRADHGVEVKEGMAHEDRQRPGDPKRHSDRQRHPAKRIAHRDPPGGPDAEGDGDADADSPTSRAPSALIASVHDEADGDQRMPIVVTQRRRSQPRARPRQQAGQGQQPNPAKWKCVAVSSTIIGEKPVSMPRRPTSVNAAATPQKPSATSSTRSVELAQSKERGMVETVACCAPRPPPTPSEPAGARGGCDGNQAAAEAGSRGRAASGAGQPPRTYQGLRRAAGEGGHDDSGASSMMRRPAELAARDQCARHTQRPDDDDPGLAIIPPRLSRPPADVDSGAGGLSIDTCYYLVAYRENRASSCRNPDMPRSLDVRASRRRRPGAPRKSRRSPQSPRVCEDDQQDVATDRRVDDGEDPDVPVHGAGADRQRWASTIPRPKLEAPLA